MNAEGHSAADRLISELDPTHRRGNGASPEQLSLLEARLGVALPSDYKAFLAFANGWEGFHGECYLQLDPIEDVLAGDDLFRSLFPAMIAIGGDGGLETFALDYRSGDVCGGLVAVDRNSPVHGTYGSWGRPLPRHCRSSDPTRWSLAGVATLNGAPSGEGPPPAKSSVPSLTVRSNAPLVEGESGR